MPWTCLCMLSDRECALRFPEFNLSTSESAGQLPREPLQTSSAFLSCAPPIKQQSSPDERGGTANEFGFKQSLVLSSRRNGRQNHRARGNQKRKRSGNPNARHAA